MKCNPSNALARSNGRFELCGSVRNGNGPRAARQHSKRSYVNTFIQESIDISSGEELIIGSGSSLLSATRGGVSNTTLLRTSGKHDRVIGFNDSRINTLRKIVGISNEDGGRLETLRGDDRLRAVSRDKDNILSAEFAIGISNANSGVIDVGHGDDIVIAKAINNNGKNVFGAFNFAQFDLGGGENHFIGEAINDSADTEKLFGIYNEGRYQVLPPDFDKTAAEVVAEFDQDDGVIVAGAGSDVVEGLGDGQAVSICGIVNFGVLKLKSGNDSLIGRATGVASLQNHGISNLGIIETGPGNDLVIGSQVNLAPSGNELDAGIYNDGLISTGRGEDIVDALVGGFVSGYTLWQPGLVDLGGDDDILKGYGAGVFDGGSGEDRILLGEGIYTASIDQDGAGTLMKDGSSLVMEIHNFEKIGGSVDGLTSLISGRYEINEQQVLVDF